MAASGHGITIGPVLGVHPLYLSTEGNAMNFVRPQRFWRQPTWFRAADSLYTIGVGVLVIAILLAGGARTAASFLGGRIGQAVAWALTAVVVAVIVGSGYAIYVSSKRTVDRTGITTGQFGQ